MKRSDRIIRQKNYSPQMIDQTIFIQSYPLTHPFILKPRPEFLFLNKFHSIKISTFIQYPK